MIHHKQDSERHGVYEVKEFKKNIKEKVQ